MRNMKKWLAVLMVTVLSLTCLVGCGGDSKTGTDRNGKDTAGRKEISISYWKAGLGTDWLEAVAAAFEEKYPEYYVNVMSSSATSTVKATWEMPEVDEYDLYLAAKHYDTTYMEPLDTLLDTTADGDSKTIREKFNSGYLAFEEAADGHYYTLTFGGGVAGLVYNTELFEEAGITQYPRTSDELVLVCDTLYSKKITPLCHFYNNGKICGYYDYMIQLYQVQYDGSDYVANNFYKCTDETGKTPSKEIFTKEDGRYKTLLAFEKFITPEYTLLGSNTKSHTEIQTEFLNDKAAMMINGSWLENEMSSVAENVDKFTEVRIPVLSAIIDRLSTVKNDSVLRKVVSAIDQVTAGEKQLSDFASGEDYVVEGVTVSKADWDIVWEARNTVPANYSESSAWIPNYADEKEGAMKFLEFLYSDEGYKVYTDTLNLPLPMSLSTGEAVDTSTWSAFEKLQFDFLSTAENIANDGYSGIHRIFTDGGAEKMAGIGWIDDLCSQNAADRMTADEIWKDILKTVEDNYTTTWLENIK